MEFSRKRIFVASHREDIDGIASAALIKRIFPEAIIFLLTPVEILKNKTTPFDIVVDLPKPKNCKVNIDHHISNYQKLIAEKRLTSDDLVDPTAPSAAFLVAKYFDLNDNLSKELVEIANLADTGEINNELLLLDLYIKDNITNTSKLLWLVDKLSKYGKRIIYLPEATSEFKRARELLRYYYKIKNKVLDLMKKNIKVVIFDSTSLPYALAKLPPTLFVKMGGIAGISYYVDPLSGKIRFSIRLNKKSKLNAYKIARYFGGGGHELSAGFVVDRDNDVGYVIYRSLHLFQVHSIVFLKVTFSEI